MLEIDLPRMQSLSPQLDSPPPTNAPVQGMTNLNLTDIEPITTVHTSSSSINQAKNCEWNNNETEICGCKYTNKSGCGCKYINKVCVWLICSVRIWYHKNGGKIFIPFSHFTIEKKRKKYFDHILSECLVRGSSKYNDLSKSSINYLNLIFFHCLRSHWIQKRLTYSLVFSHFFFSRLVKSNIWHGTLPTNKDFRCTIF